jgi:uncharacterized protein involved in oxidation of intracellular sulfur
MASRRSARDEDLLILNDSPYGTERCYNGLRLAGNLAKREGEELRVFLIGDAAGCAKHGQKVPQGYYNLNVMLGAIARRGGEVGVCGSCMDARGMSTEELTPGTRRSSMDELGDWTLWAERVIVF